MAESARSANIDLGGNPGPYIAVVRNHLDSKYMGSLEVELLKNSDAGWMVPPDIGTRVMVMFVEGNAAKGYWFGCVQDEFMNFMLPGNAFTTFNDKDNSKPHPVGEYNKRVETAKGRDPTKFIKPHNDLFTVALEQQGLLEDTTRGSTTSSARRELPSSVFGISTPGPLDRRSGAPRVKYGEKFAQSDVHFNRLGGTTFVMDDGDANFNRKTPAGGENGGPPEYVNVEAGESGGDPTLPHNDLVRIRTRTGHQILMHNSEDLIYIGNAKGTSWIELSSNGKIDIYAQDSISLHTENDLNVTADRDINFQAGRNINFNASDNIFQTASTNWEIKAGSDGKITVGGQSNIKAGGNHVETASQIHMNGPGAAEAAEAKTPFRVPQHEPWMQHENLDPTKYTPEATDAGADSPPEDAAFVPIADTFKKSS